MPHKLARASMLAVLLSALAIIAGDVATASAPQTIPAKSQTTEQSKALLDKAERGDANAQFEVGRMYADGSGVPRDYAQALAWWRKAAQQRHADASYYLGMSYNYGMGVLLNKAEACAWYRKAAELGHIRAQHSLGWNYYQGDGVKQDDAQAVEWWRKCAQQGSADCQSALAGAYYLGRGVAPDRVEALKWLILAAYRQEPMEAAAARKSRDSVSSQLTPEQVKDAEKRASEWMATFGKQKQ